MSDKKPTKSVRTSTDDNIQLAHLITTKFGNALTNLGYGRADQIKVDDLVEKNLLVHNVQLGALSVIDGLSGTDLVKSCLQQLLASEVRVNSNEPVLLIQTVNPESSPETVSSLREKTCMVLRDTFNIFPVRVYVARSYAQSSSKISERSGFTVALLNVVNTEIGGPGMIQLLDNSHPCPEWDQSILLAQAWHRTDLVWRYEKTLESDNSVQKTSSDAQATHHPAQSQEMRETAQDDLVQSEPTVPNEVFEDAADDHVPSDDEIVEVSAPVEHPAMAELRAREAGRPQIQHPSWDHIHSSDSLVDIIRRQAAIAEDAEDDGEFVGASVDGSVLPNTKAHDHGFELV